ncbi:protein-S-isoprenylcysteine O-methyltransferase Ste14 [Methanomicrobium sp. W14]|nr:protein-S-isoprenylcysteine O-methyltransferase Ste14 [Methanomicrobium sp. W14]
MYVVIFGVFFSIYAAIFIHDNYNISLTAIFYWIGILLMAGGIALRCFSIWMLKESFTLSVMTKTNQSLVRNGPYQYIRHPAYAGSILTLLGFAFVLRTLLAPFAVLAICICTYGYRIFIEEKSLLKHFGKQYQDYCKNTWRLIPKIW